jgi:hypothetical protein
MSTLNVSNLAGPSNTGTAATLSSINGGPISGARNRIINGDMRVWQRGTSFSGMTPSLGVPAYAADRWFVNQLTSQSSTDVTQQTGGATRFSIRVQKRSGSTGASTNQLGQLIENLNCLDLPGKQITLSFTAKAGANYSATGNALSVSIFTCTTADQSSTTFVNGTATGQATLYSGTVTLTTSNQTFSITTSAVAANATNICLVFTENSSASAAGANDWFEISDVQIEAGTVATPFERRSYGQELALCQRYYEVTGNSTFFYTFNTAASIWRNACRFQVPKRASPTVTLFGPNTGSFFPNLPTVFVTGTDNFDFGDNAAASFNVFTAYAEL